MLRIYNSNRLERLFDQLTSILEEPLSDPFAPELVVTQSQGMARWLALNLAERTGIAANIEFALPATYIWRTFVQQLPGLTDTAAFDRRVLAWRLMGLLPPMLEKPLFAELAHYVDGPRPELRRWQLCRQIADVFDQYLIYRPDMLLKWERGEGEEWQADLWRALAQGADSPHRAELWEALLHRCDRNELDRTNLPERLIIFGIPTLPPAYLEVLRRLGEVIEIHLLVLNPCLLYWGDIEEPRNIARLRKARGKVHGEDYYTIGNPLLASLGRQGRDFIDLLHTLPVEEEELFEANDEATLLHAIQSDILTLTDRSRGEAPRFSIEENDRSLQIHACHSPMREVEVLHDQLLALFDADPTLRPQDVIVMTPNIEEYAPFVEAVFGATRDNRQIPFSVADLSRQSEHPVVQAFVQLLDTATGRFAASDVLSLLEVAPVLRRFGLDQEEYDTLRRWISESGIRWGLDGRSRAQWELPEAEANSWEFGFRRLFLGYALPPAAEKESLFAGVLPYPHVEGHAAAALGRLRSFIERLAHYGTRLRGNYTAQQWAALLNDLIDAFFQPEQEDEAPIQLLRDAAAALVEESERARYDAPFGLDLLRDFIHGQVAEPSSGQHFLTGRVTFCAMIPMRSVPFRVVCLLGLGDQAFPRIRRPVGFDKIAEEPRRGDRSRREDDRYLFLEALLSARDVFYVSYVGRNIRDNSLLLPSLLVTELLDYVIASSEEIPRSRWITEHPLQPFNPRYFDDSHPALFSYAAEWLTSWQARAAAGSEAAPFLSEPLPALPHGEPVELAALVRFFRHPARTLLRERLGLQFGAADEVVEDSEPFALDRIAAWDLKEELLNDAVQGADLAMHETLVRARGTLPDGAFGHLSFEAQRETVEAIAERVRPHLDSPLPPLEVNLALENGTLVGWLQQRTTGGLLRYRAAKIGARDLLELWINHLALNAMQPIDGAPHSRLIGEDGSALFGTVKEAKQHLNDLLALYQEGMRAPLPFMPASSLIYAQQCTANDRETACDKARHQWNGSDFHTGDGTDAYCTIAFRGGDPIDDRFEAIAATIFDPLIAAWEEE